MATTSPLDPEPSTSNEVGFVPQIPSEGVVDSVKPPAPVRTSCPSEMVLVSGTFCIDRFEAQIVDKRTGKTWPHNLPPNVSKARYVLAQLEPIVGTGTAEEKSMALPSLPGWAERGFEPVAVSRGKVKPQSYASGKDAALACKNAKKRLCKETEWTTACRGEAGRPFPYGEVYKPGVCNVFREGHPASILWDNPSIHHTDPRLVLVRAKGGPLLRATGETKECHSDWGQDQIFDLVGNLDEWIDDEEGTFVGGFFSRGTKAGCASRIASHVLSYADYSTGFRCCRDPE